MFYGIPDGEDSAFLEDDFYAAREFEREESVELRDDE